MATAREDLQALLTDDHAIRVGLREVNIWPDTIRAWLEQGYPAQEVMSKTGQVTTEPFDWRDYFGYDMVIVGGLFNLLPWPDCREVLEETGDWIITRDGAGAVLKQWKHRSGTPEHIDFHMTSRDVWEREYRAPLLEVDRDRVDIEGAKRELERRRSQGLWTFYQHQSIWETMRQTMGDICMYTSLALDPDWIMISTASTPTFSKPTLSFFLMKPACPIVFACAKTLAIKMACSARPTCWKNLSSPITRNW